MLKLAVIGAQTLLGREFVAALDPLDCSVVPLTTGPMTQAEEEGDLVVFAPSPALLEGLDAVLLTDTLQDETLLAAFPGKVLDLRTTPDPKADPLPLAGGWPDGARVLRARPALEQVLALLPKLITGLGEVGGTHLRSVAALGDAGVDGLLEQTVALIQGEDPNTEKLGYRAAFEVIPQVPRGALVEVRVPTFHGDLLLLTLRAAEGQTLGKGEAPAATAWVDAPPSSRDVAVSSDLLAHFAPTEEGRRAVLTLGYDPILWGALRPVVRVLGL